MNKVLLICLSLINITSYCYTQVDLFSAIKDADIQKVKQCIDEGVDTTNPIPSLQNYTPLIFALESWNDSSLKLQGYKQLAIGFFGTGVGLLCCGAGIQRLIFHDKIIAYNPMYTAGIGSILLGLIFGAMGLYLKTNKYLEIAKLIIKNPSTDVSFKTTDNKTALYIINNIKIFSKSIAAQADEIERMLIDRLAEQKTKNEQL